MLIFATSPLVLLVASAFGSYVFPDDFQLCKNDDENLNACLVSAIQDALPKLAEGISSPISIKTEPMLYPYYEYHHKNKIWNLDEYCFNMSHTGLSESIVMSVSLDLANLALNMTTFTPHFVQRATYAVNGTLLYNGTRDPEPFWGNGLVVKEIYNTTILHQMKSKALVKDGETYAEMLSYNVSFSVDLLTLDYQNIYNGTDPEMAERTVPYVNATAMYIIADQEQNVADFLAGMFKSYAKPIIGSVPLNKIVLGI